MQDTKIEILWKEELSAVVTVLNNQVSVQYFTDDPVKYFLPQIPMDVYMLQHFLETRCYPRNRDGIDKILQTWGLDCYDPLTMCKITHGLMRNDYLWLRFDDELLTYEKVKIREG